MSNQYKTAFYVLVAITIILIIAAGAFVIGIKKGSRNIEQNRGGLVAQNQADIKQIEITAPGYTKKTGVISWTNRFNKVERFNRQMYGIDLETEEKIPYDESTRYNIPRRMDFLIERGFIRTGGVFARVGNNYEDYVRISREECDRIQREIGTQELSYLEKNFQKNKNVYCIYTNEGNFAKILVTDLGTSEEGTTDYVSYRAEYTLWKRN